MAKKVASGVFKLYVVAGVSLLLNLCLIYWHVALPKRPEVIEVSSEEKARSLRAARYAHYCNSSLQEDKEFSWLFTRDIAYYTRPSEDSTLYEPEFVCGLDGQEPVFLLVVVMSPPSHFGHRDAIRRTWGSELTKMRSDVRMVFFLGLVNDTHFQSEVTAEVTRHGDIVQVELCDSYRNLTLKVVHMLKWTLKRCPRARFIMKADDDIFISPANLLRMLEQHERKSEDYVLIGSVIQNRLEHAPPRSKWYVPETLRLQHPLPHNLHGPSYIFSGSLLPRLYNESLDTPFVNMEDLFLTGLVAVQRLGLNVTDDRGFHVIKPFHICSYLNVIRVHSFTPQELLMAWRRVADFKKEVSRTGGKLCSTSRVKHLEMEYSRVP